MLPILIIYTHTEPQLLGRVVRATNPCRVFVHVDQKVRIDPFIESVRAQDALQRVSFLGDRGRVNWAGWSQVVAIRKLINAALVEADPAQYIVLLSGQCYPIKPVSELCRFLDSSGSQFLRCFSIAESDSAYHRQMDHRHFRDLPFLSTHTQHTLARKSRNALIRFLEFGARRTTLRPPPNITKAHGPTHFAITARFAAQIEAMITPEIEEYFSRTFCPEETLYQSLCASSELRWQLPAGGLDPFVGIGNHQYANLHHIHPSLTKVYTVDDAQEVLESESFFLRKLQYGASAELLELIDRELLDLPTSKSCS